MNVSACLVTRGDVDMQPIIDSLPVEWEKVVWVNGEAIYVNGKRQWGVKAGDIAVYGRYAAIEYASHDLCYVQDDDCIVSNPEAITDEWLRLEGLPEDHPGHPHSHHVVCNVPVEFRPHYPDSGLVGFGAAFHRDAPKRAFDRWWSDYFHNDAIDPASGERGFFHRRADNWFTVLTPRVLVDVPKTDLPYASDPTRMWRQSDHVGERDRMIELARQVRDA